MRTSLALVLLAVLLLVSVPAYADIIVLHNTGEGLMPGFPDPNWTVARLDGTFLGQAISAIDRTDHDPAGWITPTSGNTWISTVAQGNIEPGVYKYSTTFVIGPGLDPSTAQLSGYWWADDAGFNHDGIHWNGIYLNGVKVSNFEGRRSYRPGLESGFLQHQLRVRLRRQRAHVLGRNL